MGCATPGRVATAVCLRCRDGCRRPTLARDSFRGVAGVPLLQAVSVAVAGEILIATLFGQAMAWHLGLAVVLAVVLVLARAVVERRSLVRIDLIRGAPSAGVLATLAWMGHAAATRGTDRYMHLGGDVVHLLAAGAWLGALPLLAMVLVRAAQRQSVEFDRVALITTRRFSGIGVTCVGALLATGTINAWYLVGTPAALIGTVYGQLLLTKLAFFAVMLALAVHNRLILTPRIQEAISPKAEVARVAMRRITRNARVETTLGVAIVVIVGALGISVPGAHTEISWPLSFALDLNALDEDHRLQHVFSALILIGLVAAAFALRSFRRERRTTGFVAIVVATSSLALFGYLSVIPAHPTTYARSPVRYTTAAVAAGATLYRSNCETCHGADGLGDGPAAMSIPVRPPNLTSGHALHHLPGDLYWQIAHGIPGTPMPAFEGRLAPGEIWELVTFLHALADDQVARRLTSRVSDWRPIIAPDFPFETAGGEQETLEEQRGRYAVLLVLYAYPESRTRLIALTEARATLERAGIRVIAIQFDARPPVTAEGIDPAILAISDPTVVTAYARFLPPLSGAPEGTQPRDAEVFIDRNGYIRSVRIGPDSAPANRVADLVRDADQLGREPRRPPAFGIHMH